MNEDRFQRMEADLKAIKDAVTGNPEIGLTGLVKRVAKLEAKMDTMVLRLAAASGCVAGGWFIIEKFFLK